ncbi:MAG: hypothetical protein ACREDK_00300 [Thermoplasmata archaeon]
MSPRKSSTSSGRPVALRPRYLAIEVAGDQPLSPRYLEGALVARLGLLDVPGRVRLIRAEGNRALVEVPHRAVAAARIAWTGAWTTDRGAPLATVTRRTYGTLVKGKVWLRGARPGSSRRLGREV